jgi:hypothetical protein
MSDTTSYTPPKKWTWDAPSGGHFASINRPIAGAVFEAELPVGQHPLQLYSMATPNGVKVTQIRESPIPESQVRVTALAVEFDLQYRTPTGEGLFLRKEAL